MNTRFCRKPVVSQFSMILGPYFGHSGSLSHEKLGPYLVPISTRDTNWLMSKLLQTWKSYLPG